ncbi:MAG: HAD family hydrolase [Simkaniaceae bacterium]|nr:HAD family hydrolase [Simkaniaceae bacterium]
MLIIFDLDDTLIDTTYSITPNKLEKALERLMNAGATIGDFNTALEALKRLDETAMSSSNSLAEFLEINELGPKMKNLAFDEMRSNDLKDIGVACREGLEEMIEELSCDHTLAIVTSGDENLQRQKMEKARIPLRKFSEVIICPPGAKEKPYRELMLDFELDPQEILVCGDRVKNDLLPAKKLGLITVHMRYGRGLNCRDHGDLVDFEISDLNQLSDIIAHIERYNYLRKI